MPIATLLPMPRAVFYDQSGNPLAGGFVHTYIPNTLTPKTTWQDSAEATPNANPIVLDANGSCLLYGSGSYDIATTDSLGNSIAAYSGVTTDTLSQAAADIAALQTQVDAMRVPRNSAITFYVNGSTGNNANDGLTTGTAWQTINFAIRTVANNNDAKGVYITIQVAAGTYAESVVLLNFVGSFEREGLADSTGIRLRGDPTTPANVIISQNVAGFCINAPGITTNWVIDGFELHNPSGSLLLADWGSTLSIGSMNWGACSQNMIQAQYNSRVELMRGSVQKIVGSTAGAFASANACSIILVQGHSGLTVCEINIAAALTVGAGASATNLSFIDLTEASFTGSSITGTAWGATNSLYSQFSDNIFPATLKGSQQGIRIPATGAIVYNVTVFGNDNSGRGTAGSPFLTVQAAINYALSQMDTIGLPITINVGVGTFAGAVVVSQIPVGGGYINIVGQGVAATLISTGSDSVTATNGALIAISQIAVAGTGNCLRASLGGQIVVNGALTFGISAAALARADTGGIITIASNWAISANAANALLATQGGKVILSGSPVCTVAGALTFSNAFASVTDLGLLTTGGATFSTNVATGTRIICTTNSVINTSGAGATYFPGNVNGAATTGGQYV